MVIFDSLDLYLPSFEGMICGRECEEEGKKRKKARVNFWVKNNLF